MSGLDNYCRSLGQRTNIIHKLHLPQFFNLFLDKKWNCAVIERGRSLTWKSWMVGIEGKGCKILSRLSLSATSQLEVSSAHSVPGSALQHWDRCHCLCSRVTDCLTLWGQAWLNLNGITASSRGRAVQIHCSAIHVTLTAGLKTDWHCTHGFSTSVQSGLERVFGYVKLFINFLSFCWRG